MKDIVEIIIQFLNGFSLQNLIGMVVIVWYFTSDMKKELKASIDSLDRDVRAMNTRMSRLEGTVYGKDIYKTITQEE
jgi:hypothetical protein